MTMNFEQARLNMVENQVRPWDVLDARVLDVLGRVRREDFVAPAHRALAFADLGLPLGPGDVMMKPVVEGRVLQALALQPHERVLEIGTGSGFLTACLAHLATQVTSVDIRPEFTTAAAERLQTAGVGNVELLTADAVRDWRAPAPYDALVATGAVAEIPAAWADWLTPTGRMMVIRGQSPVQHAVLLQRESGGRETRLFETDLPYLTHAEPPRRFVF